MTEHTPTPWQQGRLLSTAVTREWDENHLEQGEYEESALVCVNFHASDQGRSRRIVAVATHMDGNAGANAAFIVRAVNSHAALVAALRAVEWGAADGYGDPRCPSCGVRQFGNSHAPDCQLDKALRAAEPD